MMTKRTAVFLVFLPFIVGCNSLNRLISGPDNPMPPPPATLLAVEGILAGEKECVSIARLDPALPFEVYVNGGKLNTHEFKYLISRSICFGRDAWVLADGRIVFSGPVSHAGDHYRVQSVTP